MNAQRRLQDYQCMLFRMSTLLRTGWKAFNTCRTYDCLASSVLLRPAKTSASPRIVLTGIKKERAVARLQCLQCSIGIRARAGDPGHHCRDVFCHLAELQAFKFLPMLLIPRKSVLLLRKLLDRRELKNYYSNLII